MRPKYKTLYLKQKRTNKLITQASFVMAILLGLVLLGSFLRAEQELISPLPAHAQTSMPTPYAKLIEVEVPKVPCDGEKCDIISYIMEKFGEEGINAITMVRKCENSKFDPKATNWNSNGTWDTGIFQINQVHGRTLEDMQNWKQNVDQAYKIFQSRGWTAWSCSHEIGVKPFWK